MPVDVFLSYAQEDAALCEELERHLTPLERAQMIEVWSARRLEAGDPSDQIIDAHLASAGMVLLLVSADYIASDHLREHHVKKALARSRAGSARVIPVLLRPCHWEIDAFEGLQPLPSNRIPVRSWRERDEAWTDVGRGIRQAIMAMESSLKPKAGSERQAPPRAMAPSNLARRRKFVGREPALRSLEEAFERTQVVSVCGLAGIGKTALALEHAHRAALAGKYPGGVFWVLAEGSPLDAMTRLVAALRASVPAFRDQASKDASAEEQAEFARIFLQDEPLPSLLVLDNVSARGLEDRLPGGSTHVLATVRDDSWAVGEPLTLQSLDDMEARALVVSVSGLPLKGAEQQACERVVRDELGGLAAAVEVAARAVKAWADTWVAYEAYLEKRAVVALDDARDRSQHYPRGVFAAIDLSIDQCMEMSAERDLVVGMAMFAPDSVPREWLLATTGVNTAEPEGRRALAALINWGLVRVDPKTGMLSMHRLVHRRARERFQAYRYKVLPCVRTWLTQTVGRGREQMQLVDERQAHINEALGAAEQPGNEADWIQIANDLARHYRYRGRYAEAITLSQRATELARAWNERGEAYIASLSNQALALQALGKAEEAVPLLEEALAALNRAGHTEDLRGALGLATLARVLPDVGEDNRARALFELALKITEDLRGPDHPEVANSLSNLAGVLVYQGEPTRALELLERAVAIVEEHCAPDDPGAIAVMSTRAIALRAAGKPEEALPLAQRVLEAEEESYGRDHPKVAKSLLRLANVLRSLDRPADAKPLLERARTIAERTFVADKAQLTKVLWRFEGLIKGLDIDDEGTSVGLRTVIIGPRGSADVTIVQTAVSDFDERTRVTQVAQVHPGGDFPRNTTDCVVVIYSKEPTLLGKRFVLENNPTRVGRNADNHIPLFEGDSVSRRHTRFEQRGSSWFAIDEGSTNGTYLNDEQLVRATELKNGDRVKIGPVVFKFFSGSDVEAQYHEEVYRMTIMDGLTQIHNKRYLLEALEREIIRGRRHERDLSILLLDIDHFKRINDVHGHLAGDFVLKELVRVMQACIRRDEVFARYGGEEFAIILPETSLEGAVALAETLRQKVSEHLFVFQADSIKVTISIGAALLHDSDRAATEFIKRADERLYLAKNSGRNRVCA